MIILNFPTLIAIAVLYLLEFSIGAIMCRYVSIKHIAVTNIILGILGVSVFYIFDAVVPVPTQNSLIYLIMASFYICIPNLILYFKMRSIRKRSGSEKEKYSFKRNAGMAAILTVCHFPTVTIAFAMSITVVQY